MPDPLIESPTMVGNWDGDAGGWSARDWVPGPAGTVGLTLPGGVELDVDVASPNTFVGLWVPADRTGRPSPDGTDAIRSLLGDARAEQLLGTKTDRPRQLVGGLERRSRRRRPQGSFDRTEPGVDRTLARHALAAASAADLGATDLAVALSSLDAAASATALDGLLGRAAGAVAERGVRMLVDLWPDIGDTDGAALREALRRIERFLPPSLRVDVGQLRDELEPRSVVGAWAAPDALESMDGAADLLPSLARTPTPVAPLMPVDVRTLAESYDVAAAAGRATSASEAEVRIPGRADLADRLWARCFDSAGAIVAAAPMLDVDGDAVARLLVPPATLADASLDLTDRPGDLRLPQTVGTSLAAIHHGRDAARAERLGDRHSARARWQSSSSAWAEARDGDRSKLALRFAADGGPGGRVPRPLLADPVVEAGQ